MRRLNLETINTELLDFVLADVPFPRILEDVYRKTRLPTIAFDVSFGLIAYAFERPFSVYGWELLASEGAVSENLVLSNNYLEIEDRVLSNRSSLIVDTAGNAELKTAFGPVFKDNVLVAYVATMLADADADDVLMLNDLICRTLSLHYSDRGISGDGRGGRDILLENHISGASLSEFSKRYKPPYLTALMQSVTASSAKMNYVKSRIDLLPNCVSEIDPHGNLRILFESVDSALYYRQICTSLERVCLKYGCTAGLSDRFTDISRVSVWITQARLCMQLAGRLHPRMSFASFAEHYIKAMSFALLCSPGYDESYYMRHIERVKNAYPKKSTALLKTLSVYMDNGFDAGRAAEVLGVHKNTVAYRVRLLCQLLDIDLSGAQADMLLLELALYEIGANMKDECDEE